MFNEIIALSKIIFLSGMRKHSVWSLCIFALILEFSGIFFIDFFGRDLGRIATDYIFTIMWCSGLLFILFYAVQTASWDDDNRMIDTILSKPISRVKYVIGMFTGLSLLLLFFEFVVLVSAYAEIKWIGSVVGDDYFPLFNDVNFILSWLSMQVALVLILSIVMFSTSIMRGGFPVMLMTLSYYFIGSGLPVIRQIVDSEVNADGSFSVLRVIQMIFPDLSGLDNKAYILSNESLLTFVNLEYIAGSILYVFIIITLTCLIYKRKDIL